MLDFNLPSVTCVYEKKTDVDHLEKAPYVDVPLPHISHVDVLQRSKFIEC